MSENLSEHPIVAVVVTYQSESTIDMCLKCLREAEGISQIRIVDNNSNDGTLAIIRRHALADSRIRFIANTDNKGFAIACNQGANDSTAEWIAFINPDVMVEKTDIFRLYQYAKPFELCLLGTNLVDINNNNDGAARRNDPDFLMMLKNPWKTQLSIPEDNNQSLQIVPAISGAVMLMPRRLFILLNGWDEEYRLHVEDLDLCRRSRLLGATVAIANDINVLHLRGVSSRSRPVFVEWHKHWGLWRYFRKFEAKQRSGIICALVALMISVHFILVIIKKLLGK